MSRLFLLTAILMVMTGQDSKRQLLIFTDSLQNKDCQQQTFIVDSDKPGLNDRDVVVKIYNHNTANLRYFKKYKITAGFTVILVGKDGGEKYRDTRPILLKHLYGLIDAMPMRKAEIKESAQ